MSVNPWLNLLSTLSLRDRASACSPFGPKVALLGAESSDWGRSNSRLGSALPGVVGETMEATLMLPAGETRGCGSRLLVVGDGVLSVGEVWNDELIGLKTPEPKPEAAEVSGGMESVQRAYGAVYGVGCGAETDVCSRHRYWRNRPSPGC